MKKNLLISSILLISILAYSEPIKDSDAIKAIIGEAANQGYKGQLAVAGAIRNRTTLKGVYGLKSDMVASQPKRVWDMAKKAWNESKTNDISLGATHWENIKAFGNPYWTKRMKKTVLIKDHQFYKN